ncbi:DUF6470 family protein [Solibacillus sp. FSL K6-1523]|uniref:DUF6470 family protein n=1 Tax=Solibacillus sp. FSL K6-1523 TaxID=2921471 RepID=UPI0030F70520
MRIPQIQITKTDIQMNWNTSKSQQIIKQPQATLKISQPAATLEIRTTNAKLDINMDQMWRDLGITPTGEVIAEYAQKGKQGALQGIARRVSEGYQLMKGGGRGQEGATIPQIAKQNHGPQRPGPYNIKFIPSIGSVKVNITPGTTDVNIQRNAPKIDAQVNKPIHQYTPGKVTGTMVQRPDVQIDVVG